MAVHHRLAASLVLAAAVAAIALLLLRDATRVDGGEGTVASVPSPAPRASGGGGAVVEPDSGTSAPEPLPEGPIGETYGTLARRAHAGDGVAALRLADLLGLCASYVPMSREAAEEAIVDTMAKFDPPRTEGQSLQQDLLIALASGVMERQRAECPGFETLGLGDPAEEQLRWAGIAARAGEARAIVQLADAEIRKYRSAGEIVQHAEELRRARPQALALVQQAAARGEPTAFLRLAAAHRTGDLAPVDPVEAYAWMLAYRAGPPAPGVSGFAFQYALRQYEMPLDDAQRARAQRRAEAIRAACCAGS